MHRNVALIGHGGSGKTTLAEALLFANGAINRMGKVEEGSTVMDFEPEETKRHMSVSVSVAPFMVGKTKINLLDTPGYADFLGDVVSALHVVDGAVIVLSAQSGVEVQSEIVWQRASAEHMPRFIFVNRMDRENADFNKAVSMAQEAWGSSVIIAELPIGSAESFEGVVDIPSLKAHRYSNGKSTEGDVPPELLAEAEKLRERLLDAAVETDEELMEKYLAGEELSADEIRKGIHAGVLQGTLVPVFCGSASKMIGVDRLTDAIVGWFPTPDEIRHEAVDGEGKAVELARDETGSPVAYVFKTMTDPYLGRLNMFRVYSGQVKVDSTLYNANQDKSEKLSAIFTLFGKKSESSTVIEAGDIGAVAKLADTHTGDTLCTKEAVVKVTEPEYPEPVYQQAIEPKTKGDEEKLSSSLARLAEEDPTFNVSRDSEMHQTVVSGLGEMHIDMMLDRLRRKFSVEAQVHETRISYRETIRGKARVQGRYKKQTGGRGQFGDCWIEIEPLPRGGGFEFVDKIFGGSIPQQFRPAVEKGIREVMEEGVLAGCPFVDVKVTLVDGSYHSVDSSEMAFKIAGSMAFKKGVEDAGGMLLEPIMKVDIIAPESMIGDIMGDLNARRGKVAGMEPLEGHMERVSAMVPLAEMQRYAIELRSITQARGTFHMELDHYEEVPAHVYDKIVAAQQEAKKALA